MVLKSLAQINCLVLQDLTLWVGFSTGLMRYNAKVPSSLAFFLFFFSFFIKLKLFVRHWPRSTRSQMATTSAA